MKKYLWLIIIFFTLNLHSQEILTKEDIYTENNLVYKVANKQLFTGKIQNFKHKNHLVFEILFENGIIVKSIVYYNGKEKIVSREMFYYDNDRQIEKRIDYSLDHKTMWIDYFEELGNKKLKEVIENGTVIYSCPYNKNKKHDKVFSINEKGEKNECVYENGKLIKTDKAKPNG